MATKRKQHSVEQTVAALKQAELDENTRFKTQRAFDWLLRLGRTRDQDRFADRA